MRVTVCVQEAQLVYYHNLILQNNKLEGNFELNYICVLNQEANIIDSVITVFC